MGKLQSYLKREFIDEHDHAFKFQIGRMVATSLTSFIAGVIFSSIFWIGVIFLLNAYR